MIIELDGVTTYLFAIMYFKEDNSIQSIIFIRGMTIYLLKASEVCHILIQTIMYF